jgi:hypothetical protein
MPEMDKNDKPVKPEFEMFFGVKYKAYCGACERLIWTGGRYFNVEDAKQRWPKCPHCGTEVDWDA